MAPINKPFVQCMKDLRRQYKLLRAGWRQLHSPGKKTLWYAKVFTAKGDTRVCASIELAEAAEKQFATIEKWEKGQKK